MKCISRTNPYSLLDFFGTIPQRMSEERAFASIRLKARSTVTTSSDNKLRRYRQICTHTYSYIQDVSTYIQIHTDTYRYRYPPITAGRGHEGQGQWETLPGRWGNSDTPHWLRLA